MKGEYILKGKDLGEYDYSKNEEVRPGIHKYAESVVRKFLKNERTIVGIFKRQWYVTKADIINIGASEYPYFLIKAPNNLANQFNIDLEILVIFSSYPKFEPRTLDAFEYVKKKLERGRIENLCGVLISNDNEIDSKIQKYNTGENRIIVPFSYSELTTKANSEDYFIRNKFQKFFFNRDLFAFNDALKTDLYFFGRDQLVLDIINKHLSGENSGLFGLRKTGKTSIIFDVKRKILHRKGVAVFVSCQNPAISESSWYNALHFVVKCMYEDINSDLSLEGEKKLNPIYDKSDYSEDSATSNFIDEIENISKKIDHSILLMFDEVEHITFKKASNILWGEGLESVSFWKAIRSIYQSRKNKYFSFCIVGTNPVCIEYPQILHADNPIFKAVEPTFIQGFNRAQTRKMIRTLGRVMGISFEESIYQKLTDEYGGHPFLIRHVCSYISQKNIKRPITISKTNYENGKQEFNKQETEYFDMILGVLKDFYKEEYELLTYLAVKDYDTFHYFANEDPTYIKHLLGYGLIQKIEDDYEFKMEVMKDYIIKKEKLKVKTLKSIEDKWKYLVEERGKLEVSFRKMVKQVLVIEQFKDSNFNAKSYVMSKLHNSSTHKKKYGNLSINDLFNADKAEIYFSDLDKLVRGKWESFERYIKDMDQESFKHYMKVINKVGRADAHAKEKIDEKALQEVNIAFDKLSNIISSFDSTPNELSDVFS